MQHCCAKQSITLHASGLRNNDRVVFTTIDNNGNLAEETVNPASLDLATQTITVVVPDRATTGRVRLERDVTGVLLQVVPVLNDIDMGNGNDFTGSNLRLNGRGFAEGATEVLVGAQRVADLARSSGPDSFYFSNAGRPYHQRPRNGHPPRRHCFRPARHRQQSIQFEIPGYGDRRRRQPGRHDDRIERLC